MSLRDLVKSYSADIATATVATLATPGSRDGPHVAKVADVAVADEQNTNLPVAKVASVAVAGDANGSNHLRHTKRWRWFVSLAQEHSIAPEVAAASFPTPQDRLDVVEPPEHTDDRLRACMATLCRSIEVRQRQAEHEREYESRRSR